MATQDRFSLEPIIETAPSPRKEPQGELFARLALRALPVMKYGPEDESFFTSPTVH